MIPQYHEHQSDEPTTSIHSPPTSTEDEEVRLQVLARSGFSGSGIAIPVMGYSIALLCIGSSPLFSDQRTEQLSSCPGAPANSQVKPVVAQEVSEQLAEIISAFAINKTQLANILCISRPTLYDWFKGKDPNDANACRLNKLREIMALAGLSASTPLNARFVRNPINSGAPSLLELLVAKELDQHAILETLQIAISQTKLAVEAQINRDRRRQTLGFREMTNDERKETLAFNVATKNWPKR